MSVCLCMAYQIMLETVSTRISLGIEKRGHLQKICSVFSNSKLQIHKWEGVSRKL